MLKHTSTAVMDVKLRIQSRNSKTTIYGILLAQTTATDNSAMVYFEERLLLL